MKGLKIYFSFQFSCLNKRTDSYPVCTHKLPEQRKSLKMPSEKYNE